MDSGVSLRDPGSGPGADGNAFVTLVTKDEYGLGALVLGQSLRASDTDAILCCMIGPDVGTKTRHILSQVWDDLIPVDEVYSKATENLQLLQRPDLDVTFTKVHVWGLTQYEKVVYLDADTLVLKNVDDLFTRPELSAAPDVGWPDFFNSGVMVLEPGEKTYKDLLGLASQEDATYDGGDQGLLNNYFSEWGVSDPEHRLPFGDNMTINANYQYGPAFRHMRDNVRIVHYIGTRKPWRSLEDSPEIAFSELRKLWWTYADRFNERVPWRLVSDKGYLPTAFNPRYSYTGILSLPEIVSWIALHGRPQFPPSVQILREVVQEIPREPTPAVSAADGSAGEPSKYPVWQSGGGLVTGTHSRTLQTALESSSAKKNAQNGRIDPFDPTEISKWGWKLVGEIEQVQKGDLWNRYDFSVVLDKLKQQLHDLNGKNLRDSREGRRVLRELSDLARLFYHCQNLFNEASSHTQSLKPGELPGTNRDAIAEAMSHARACATGLREALVVWVERVRECESKEQQ